MTQGNADITMNDRPVFSAELHPYRSLGRNGHRVFFLIAGALSFAHMAVFMISGAWPVVMFFGADFLILFGAFWLNNRAARAKEIVSLSRTSISIRKITPSGKETEYESGNLPSVETTFNVMSAFSNFINSISFGPITLPSGSMFNKALQIESHCLGSDSLK